MWMTHPEYISSYVLHDLTHNLAHAECSTQQGVSMIAVLSLMPTSIQIQCMLSNNPRVAYTNTKGTHEVKDVSNHFTGNLK